MNFTKITEAAKGLFSKPKPEPRMIDHRGMKAYFSSEMIMEFEKAKVDYEKAYRESVDEVLEGDEDEAVEDGNVYK